MAKAEIRMTEGPIAKQLVSFAIPLFLGFLFQQLYNTADALIVGNLLGNSALAAVTGTGTLIFLLVGFFGGISMGAGVVVSRFFGSREVEKMRAAIHTNIAFGMAAGVFLTVVGMLFTPQILQWMGTPEDVMPQSVAYIRTYFAGSIGLVMYNQCRGVMQAVGDSRHPLYYLIISSITNVVLDILLIAVFKMDVDGAALATILSQTVSAIMVTVLLVREEGAMHLDLRHLGFHKKAMLQIIQIGLPAGLQSTVFSLSNVVIQSAINSFGSTVVAGNSAASNLEGFIYTGMNAFAQAAVTFTSQNVGARRYDNLDRVMRNCLLCVTVVGLFLGCGAYFGGEVLLHFYSTDEAVVAAGLSRMQIICTAYFLCGIMDTLASCLRGRGYSVIPMIVSLVGSCLLRLVWIATIFRMFRSTGTLYISYPISWALTAGVHLICLLVVRKKMNDQLKEESRLAA